MTTLGSGGHGDRHRPGAQVSLADSLTHTGTNQYQLAFNVTSNHGNVSWGKTRIGVAQKKSVTHTLLYLVIVGQLLNKPNIVCPFIYL